MSLKRNKKSGDLGRKTFIQELISKEDREESNSQSDTRKIGPHKATSILRLEASDSSVLRPHHPQTSIHTPETIDSIQKNHRETSG